jgi:DNA-binding MarR family transcriptional regulator
MAADTKEILSNCLYFTANSLSRVVTRMAEEAFRPTGLSPSHVFLLMLANENPGIGPKEMSDYLQLAPSTVTRFVDTLVSRGYLERKSEGKNVGLYPTPDGLALQPDITKAWQSFHQKYCEILGETAGDALAITIDQASKKLENAGYRLACKCGKSST